MGWSCGPVKCILCSRMYNHYFVFNHVNLYFHVERLCCGGDTRWLYVSITRWQSSGQVQCAGLCIVLDATSTWGRPSTPTTTTTLHGCRWPVSKVRACAVRTTSGWTLTSQEHRKVRVTSVTDGRAHGVRKCVPPHPLTIPHLMM